MRNIMPLRLLLVFIVLLGVAGCRETTAETVVRTYVSDGLAYRQQIQLFTDGTYQHRVFQSLGNSVSTREEKWSFDRNSGQAQVFLGEFKPVAKHRDFAVHRVWGVKFPTMAFGVRKRFFGGLILTSNSDPPVEYISID